MVNDLGVQGFGYAILAYVFLVFSASRLVIHRRGRDTLIKFWFCHACTSAESFVNKRGSWARQAVAMAGLLGGHKIIGFWLDKTAGRRRRKCFRDVQPFLRERPPLDHQGGEGCDSF